MSLSYPQLYFHLLQTTINLQLLSIKFKSKSKSGSYNSRYRSTSPKIDSAANYSTSSNLYFPQLVEVKLESDDKDWSRNIVSPILVACPALVALDIENDCKYEGDTWKTPAFLNLRNLNTRKDVLEGKLFDTSCFTGLETLVVDSERDYSYSMEHTKIVGPTSIPFFETVGPSLKKLTLYGDMALTRSAYSLLTTLESLHIPSSCFWREFEPEEEENENEDEEDDSNGGIELNETELEESDEDEKYESDEEYKNYDYNPFSLPPNLLKLAVTEFNRVLPLTGLSKLQSLILFGSESAFDLSTLPSLISVTISEMEHENLLKSMKNLKTNKVPFKQLVLGYENVEDSVYDGEIWHSKEIRGRCEELRICVMSLDTGKEVEWDSIPGADEWKRKYASDSD